MNPAVCYIQHQEARGIRKDVTGGNPGSPSPCWKSKVGAIYRGEYKIVPKKDSGQMVKEARV